MATLPSSDTSTPPAQQETYTWSQSELDITMSVPVPDSLRRDEVHCKVLPRSVSLEIQGMIICSGELAREVDPDESSWTIETEAGQRLVLLSLTKVRPKSALKSARQWPCLWKSDLET
eukprot:TRINITY_DN94645_c0_g1_i1.p1 TRINITY_DN94645_c0_g1~~TRINITY_DN94645_c0_g1_i1.p1  ORF type:complete len:135 (-),score=23.46 TRINITY_DN94645_c0_g1_i1:250-603(-)